MPKEKCPYRWLILFACFLAIFFWALDYTAYSPLLGVIKDELSLSYTESGLIATSFFVGYAIGQIPWGYMTDKFGGRKVITLGLVGLSLTSAMFSYSTNILEIFLWRSLAGFLGAAVFVPSVKILSDCFTKDERALAVGLFSIGANFGFLITPPLAIAIEAWFGWRMSLLSIALLTFVSLPFVWAWVGRAPKSVKRGQNFAGSKIILRKPAFWALAYAHFIRLGLIITLVSWVPIFLMDNLSFSIVSAGLALSAMNGVAIFSGPVGGILSRRWGDFPVTALTLAGLTPALYVFSIASNIPLVWALIVVNGLLAFLYMGPMWSLSAKISPSGQVGVVGGYHNTFASVGALILPFLIGYLKDLSGSFDLGWLVVVLSCGLCFIAVQVLRFKAV